MLGPPQLWRYLVQRWCPLPSALAWTWWRAIVRAKWTRSVEWREQFLALSRRNAALTPDLVPGYLGEVGQLVTLIRLLDNLMQEGTLLARDGQRIQDRLLSLADKDGAWKPTRGYERSIQ